MCVDVMAKKYLKKQVVTITKTEEITLADDSSTHPQGTIAGLLGGILRLLKPFLSKNIKGDDDG